MVRGYECKCVQLLRERDGQFPLFPLLDILCVMLLSLEHFFLFSFFRLFCADAHVPRHALQPLASLFFFALFVC
jgi:hypothetical protein